MDYVKLEEICNITTGKRDANHGENGGDYRFYTCAIEPIKCPTYSFEGASIILPGNGANVGEVLYDDGKFEAYQRTYVLNSIKVNPRFVYYQLKGRWKKYICNKQYGSATNYIRYNNIAEFKIPLLSIEEQNKIVNLLDKADEIRAKKKLANDKLDEFLKSTFISMFGDPVKNDKGFDTTILQNIGSFKNGINYNAGDNGYSIKCIGVGDFKNGTILNSIDKLNSVEVNQTPNEEYFVRKNDIVFVRSNGSKELVGRTLLINTDLQENIVYSGFCIRLRVEQENINNMFLLQLLNTKPIKDNMKNDGHGCNIKSLNQTILGNIPVIIPPIEDQNKFAQIVEKVEAQKQKNELVIEQMNNLFNSLSQRAFKGEL